MRARRDAGARRGRRDPVVAPHPSADRARGAPAGGVDALIAATATRNATRGAIVAPAAALETAPNRSARTASVPRVAFAAPVRGSDQPASHAAAAATIVQPVINVTKPSARNDSRPPARASCSHAQTRRSRCTRVARYAATARATAQARAQAVADRESKRRPEPGSYGPAAAPSGCTIAPVPAGSRARRTACPSVAPDASTTDPTAARRAHSSACSGRASASAPAASRRAGDRLR